MQHLFFTLVPVAIGFLLGVLIGILLSRKPKLSGIVLPILSVFNTIPGIVFIGLLVLVWGAQSATVLVALGVYATFPVLKNTYAGLVSVDPQYIEAAKGCGMSAIQSLTQVELPLAMPTIIGGLRMSTVYTVSWAVLASMIGGGGLGDFIYAGISSNDNMLILMGAIPAALLAFVLGFPANEIVLPIIVMAYLAEGSIADTGSLMEMKALFTAHGWTVTTALCTMLFSLMHWPCSTTLWTIKKETGSWKWTALAALLPASLGIICCMAIHTISVFLSFFL